MDSDPQQRSTSPALGRFGVFDGAFAQYGSGGGLDLDELASLGYSTVWVPNADPTLAAVERIAVDAPTLTVGTAVVSIWSATAAELSRAFERTERAAPGRIVLGVGVSHAPLVDRDGPRYERPLAHLRDLLDTLDQQQGGPSASARMIGANGPVALELAAERSLGAIPYLVTPAAVAAARQRVGPGPILAPVQKVVLDSDPTSARSIARGRLSRYLSLPNYTNSLRRMGFGDEDVAGTGSDHLVDSLVAWGDVDRIVARIADHLEAGASHISLHVLAGEGSSPAEGWRRLGPALASLAEG